MKDFMTKIISYGIFTLFLLCVQRGYAGDVPTYFIGLQSTTSNLSGNTSPAFIYICTPMESSVPPPYICAPANIPIVSLGTNPSLQPQTTPYFQTLKTPNTYHYSTYSPLENTTGVYSALPKYRPYDDTDSIDNVSPSLPLSLLESSDSLTHSEPVSDSWSPTSNFTSNPPSLDTRQNSWYSSPVYPQNPYADNFSRNIWQNKPQYRPDKNIPSTVNPFSSQPIYQGQIKYQYVE